jgi:hypothetical protein
MAGIEQDADTGDLGPSESQDGAEEAETVTLHVLDEQRKVNRDFVCQKDVLLKEMKYFRQYLTDAPTNEEIDISVHCDVKIFEWLVAYLHNSSFPPQLGAWIGRYSRIVF